MRPRNDLPPAAAPFASVICYEVIFPELFREFVGNGAGFMANITNDAWFGTTSGPWQHLAMLPLRAVENRTAIARAANTGVSALVEPTGRIIQTLPLEAAGFLQGHLPIRRRTTVYTRVGDWFAYTCLALSAGLLGLRAASVRSPRAFTRRITLIPSEAHSMVLRLIVALTLVIELAVAAVAFAAGEEGVVLIGVDEVRRLQQTPRTYPPRRRP